MSVCGRRSVCVFVCVCGKCLCVCVCVKRIEFFILNYMLAYNDKWLRVSMCVCECEWNVHVYVCVHKENFCSFMLLRNFAWRLQASLVPPSVPSPHPFAP